MRLNTLRRLILMLALGLSGPAVAMDVAPEGFLRTEADIWAAGRAGDPEALLRLPGPAPRLVDVVVKGGRAAVKASGLADLARMARDRATTAEMLAELRRLALTTGDEAVIALLATQELTGEWAGAWDEGGSDALAARAGRGDPEAISLACRLAALPSMTMGDFAPFCRNGIALGLPETAYSLAVLHHARPDDFVGGLEKSLPGTLNVTTSRPEATALYARAAQAGHAGAQARLAHLRAIGKGGPMDEQDARHLASLSANQGNVEGKAILGLLLLQGRGGPAEPERATTLIQQAARGGNRMAQFTLATLHMRGQIVARDFIAALTWIRLSELSQRGDPPDEEADALMIEPLRRTRYVERTISTPSMKLEALSRAAALRRELDASGEWPLVEIIPGRTYSDRRP